jgi:hypothetical protein
MKSMKKILALFLAVMLVLPSVLVYAGETDSSESVAGEAGYEADEASEVKAADADDEEEYGDYGEYGAYGEYGDYGEYGPSEMTVDTKLTLDVAAAKKLLKMFGVPAIRISRIEPFLTIASDLDVKTVIADGGLQVDINLDDENAISLAGKFTEDGVVVGSTLFPNHIVTLSMDALMEMMNQQGMTSTPTDILEGEEGAEGGEEGDEEGEESVDESSATENPLAVYFERMMESCMTNAIPGEPEMGEYEFEGYTFDTKTPVNVDAKAMAADEREIVNEMLDDAAILEMVNPFLGPLKAYGIDIDNIKKINEDVMSDEHIPNVTSSVYSNSENEEMFYVVTDSTYEGEEEPFQHFTMLYEDSSHAHMNITMPEAQFEAGMEYDGNTMSASYDIGGLYIGFTVSIGDGDDPAVNVELYFNDTSKPLATATITVLPEGEITLSLDSEGKKAVALEDAFTNVFVLEDLAQEIATNALNTIMNVASKKIANVESFLASLLGGKTDKDAGITESFASSEATAA